MSLKLIYADLTRFRCDALIIPAYGSADCGEPPFRDARRSAEQSVIGNCILAESAPNCRTLIVTTAALWHGEQSETEQIAECYRSSLREAAKQNCQTVGMELIGAESGSEPNSKLLETAVETILSIPETAVLDVYLIVHRKQESAGRRSRLDAFIRSRMPAPCGAAPQSAEKEKRRFGFFRRNEHAKMTAAVPMAECEEMYGSAVSLDERLRHLDEGFTQMLLRLIDEAGMKDSECYKKANVSKQLFSKIRCDLHYKPKKETVLAFALALQLDLEQTNALLNTAGYSLSHSSIFDIIIEYFIGQRVYNVFIINEALYQYDQPVLGSE